jgi:hypothetical protein
MTSNIDNLNDTISASTVEENDTSSTVTIAAKIVATAELDLDSPTIVPAGPAGTRVIVSIKGKIYGPVINGTINSPSSDWLTIGPDATVANIDARFLIRTDTGETILQNVIGRSVRDKNDLTNSVIHSMATYEASTGGKYTHLNSKAYLGHGTKTGNKIKLIYYETS